MDFLYLDSIAFPVRSGKLYPGRDASEEFRWGIEIFCEEAPQLDFRNWHDDREEQPSDWLAGSEPFLYAQLLPLRISSPEQLIGRSYSFSQTPDDESPDWPEGIGWPFFSLYLFEHLWAYPIRIAFTEKRNTQYQVEISGKFPQSDKVYDLRVSTWLECLQDRDQ